MLPLCFNTHLSICDCLFSSVCLCTLCFTFFLFFFFLMIRLPPRSTRTDNSFPTRRSSDLLLGCGLPRWMWTPQLELTRPAETISLMMHWARSEEHTSELQSLMRISYAVFCLKKKKQKRKKERRKKHM